MSARHVFHKAYAASPATTTLFTITAPGATNYIINILGTSNDLTFVLEHSIDMTYCLSWNGSFYNNIAMDIPPTQFVWVAAGNVLSFNFTPMLGAPAGLIGMQIVLIMSDPSVPAIINF